MKACSKCGYFIKGSAVFSGEGAMSDWECKPYGAISGHEYNRAHSCKMFFIPVEQKFMTDDQVIVMASAAASEIPQGGTLNGEPLNPKNPFHTTAYYYTMFHQARAEYQAVKRENAQMIAQLAKYTMNEKAKPAQAPKRRLTRKDFILAGILLFAGIVAALRGCYGGN